MEAYPWALLLLAMCRRYLSAQGYQISVPKAKAPVLVSETLVVRIGYAYVAGPPLWILPYPVAGGEGYTQERFV